MKITLDEFLTAARLELEAFATSTRQHAETDASFYLERDVEDWWRELFAYRLIIKHEQG